MDRRIFIAALNAGIARSAWGTPALDDAGSSRTTPRPTPPSGESTQPNEILANRQPSPKIGVLGVGIKRSVLAALSRHLPCLHRAIAISANTPILRRANLGQDRLEGTITHAVLDPRQARTLASPFTAEIAQAVADLDLVLVLVGKRQRASGSATQVAHTLREQGILTLDLACLTVDDQDRLPDHALTRAVGPFVQLWRSITNSVARPDCVTEIDFDDLRHLILGREGRCTFGYASAAGPDGAHAAADLAIAHPFITRRRLRQASAALVAIETPPGALFLRETRDIVFQVRRTLPPESDILYSSVPAPSGQADGFRVSILLSGIQDG